jgi:hypothetical protein
MALYSSLSSMALAVVLLNPVFASENKTAAIATAIAIDSSNEQIEALEFAAVDFCYRGSVVDTETGEIKELYELCSEDAIEGNIDLA